MFKNVGQVTPRQRFNEEVASIDQDSTGLEVVEMSH